MTRDRERIMETPVDPTKNLKIFEEEVDRLGREQLFASAVSVYLHKDGKTLVMRQTKNNRVVGDNYVGIGGKDLLNTYWGKSVGEKVLTSTVISSIQANRFGSENIPEELAIKEVFEETNLLLKEERLKPIGCSQIKLLNEKSNEAWQIFYFTYELDGSEGELIKMYCDEGVFEWVDDKELFDKQMLPADRAILENKNPNPNFIAEAIYDEFNNIHQLRAVIFDYDSEEKKCTLWPDFNRRDQFIEATVPFGAAEHMLNQAGMLKL